MASQEADLVDLHPHFREYLSTCDSGRMTAEQAEAFIRKERLLHKRTQGLERRNHRLLRRMRPPGCWKQRCGGVINVVGLSAEPLCVANGEVARTSETRKSA